MTVDSVTCDNQAGCSDSAGTILYLTSDEVQSMRVSATSLCLVIFVSLALAGQAAFAAESPVRSVCSTIVYSTNPQYPPYDWGVAGDHFEGASIDLLAMVAPPGVKLQPALYPWKRSMSMAASGEIDLLVSLRKTPERSEYLAFTSQPAFANPIVVFVRQDRSFPYRAWKDLKGRRGGVSLGDTFGAGFDEYWRSALSVEEAPSMVENFRKLDEGRIDYFVTSSYLGQAYLATQRLKNRVVPLGPAISKQEIHFAFSKKSPCLKYLDHFNKRLGELNRKGIPEKLLKKNLERFKAQQPSTTH